MTDLFEEVEEQLRSDRYKQFGQKLLPWMLGIAAAALIAALAYWGWDTWQTKQSDAASEKYVAAMDAFTTGDRAGAQKLWTEVSRSQSKAYKALALMHLGALAATPAEAVKLFDQAADAGTDPVIADAARLKSAFALLDTASKTDLEGRLKPLVEDGRPYRIQAREALAFVKLKAGDTEGARGDFLLISQSLDAGQGAQARAQAAIGLIDSGSAKSVPSVLKSAEALPAGGLQLPQGILPAEAAAQPQGAPQQ